MKMLNGTEWTMHGTIININGMETKRDNGW